MNPVTVSMDSTPEIEQRLIERWRGMSAEEKLTLSMTMSRTVRELAIAGIRLRHPQASPREQFLRLAVVMLGPELALAAYPDIAALDRP